MELSNPITVWLVLGLLLMISEVIVPGGIVILLGAACVIVASSLALGIIEGFVQSMTLWFMTSMVLLLSFRHVTQRLVGGDAHVANTDEEVDLYNQIATVKEAIGPGQQTGRIHCLGTDWTALGDGTEIKVGTKVRIICRDNIGFVVEPVIDSV
ncbi:MULTISPECIES: NfeD family protein [Shewanella]|jgi:membrane protein implicated in regulation of membrane protease activity|uniref:NfeD family protein n=1 Tax=Shewanella TaxID=22 RepID=UPI00200EAA03|nr:NfeD family protein [Shewanella basaltis]MCL1114927.1 NfeD family protein [Shewanella basaltis]